MINLKKLQKGTNPFWAFKMIVLGVDKTAEDEVQQHYLKGAWGEGTLKSYNLAVVKLLTP